MQMFHEETGYFLQIREYADRSCRINVRTTPNGSDLDTFMFDFKGERLTVAEVKERFETWFNQ